jgi:hypothetical protein
MLFQLEIHWDEEQDYIVRAVVLVLVTCTVLQLLCVNLKLGLL